MNPLMPAQQNLHSALVGLLLQGFFDCLHHLVAIWLYGRLKSGDDLAVPVNKEFVEIPLYVAAIIGIRGLISKVFVQRIDVVPFYRYLGEYRKSHIILCRTETLDFRISARFLEAE